MGQVGDGEGGGEALHLLVLTDPGVLEEDAAGGARGLHLAADLGAVFGMGGGAANTGGAGGALAIPLTTWVDDLVVHHSTETSAPDTVDDKNITDTDDPAAFDPLLSR